MALNRIRKMRLNIPDPKLLPNQIADLLREEIVLGKIPLGQKLTEEDLTSSLGVSRTPIRQAFRILELEGLVELIPRRGVFVTELTQKDAEELYEILGMVESFATEQVIANERTALSPLEETISKMTSYVEKGNLRAIIQANFDFHYTLVEMAGNNRLVGFYQTVRNRTRVYQSMGLALQTDWMESLQDHRQILEAIRRRDTGDAVRLCREHNLKRCRRVTSLLLESSPVSD